MNRRLLGLTATVFAFCSTLSCSDKSAEISGIPLNDSTAAELRIASAAATLAQSTLEASQTTQATALLLDYQGRPVLLSAHWSSSDSSVATVNASGVVRAILPGVASIIATRGLKSGSATLTVIPSTAPVASVSVALIAGSLSVGQTTQATVTMRDSSNNVLQGRDVVWKSSNVSTATSSDSGMVTAVAAGATEISASSEGQSGVAALAVTVAVNPGTVTDLQASVTGSTSVTLSFTQVNDGTGQPATYDVRYAVAPISWGSAAAQTSGTCNTPVAGTAIGSQLSCTVLGLTPATNYNFQLVAFRGTLNLNAVFGEISSIVSATTTSSAPPPPVPVASVSVTPASSTLEIGATVQLQVTAFDANNNALTGRVVTSASANPAIASVNSLGLATAIGAGTTQITVTSEGKSAIATIIVTAAIPPPPIPVASVTVSPASSSLLIGATVQLLVTARDANDNVLTGRVVTSSSADAAIASVNSLGLVTAIGAGTTQITVTSEGKTAIATIIVTAPAPPPVPVASVSVSPASSNLLIGATVQLLVTARDANNNVLTGRVVTSSSADAAIASVNSLGLVTAIGAGTTLITVSSEGQSAIATIIVTAPAPPPPPPAPVASVTVSPASSSLLIGATVQLLVTAHDVNGNVLTGRVVTSSSANAAIASVNSLGLVTAIGAGTTQITVSSEGQSAIATIIVTAPAPPPPAPVASVSVSPASSNLLIGATVQLLVTARDANNNVLTGRVVTSSSANPAIASVNSLGLVSAISAGTTQITVSSEGQSAVATIIVSAPAPPPAVNPGTVTDLQASANGSTSVTLSFTQVNDGTGQPAKYDVRYAVTPISWGSAAAQTSGTCNTPVAGTAIGSQLSCTVLGLTPATNYNFQLVAFRGTLNLNAVFGGLSNTVSATTTASAPPPPAPVASVTVSPATSNLLIGATVQLLVTARDANNNVLTGRVVTSSSADAAIASVNSLGLVTAVSAGTTQITVTSEGQSAIATIIVTAPAPPPPPPPAPVASVTVSPASSSLLIGATVQLLVTARDANGNVLTGRVVTSSSADAAIASVNSLGLVTAIGAGTTQITVSSEGQSAIATITVTAPAPPPPPPPAPVASVTVSPATASLLIGATVQLSVTALDANGNVLTGRVVTSSSANAGIASVNSGGLVSAISAGTTQITVTSEGKSAIATITVSAPAPAPVASVTVSSASSSLLVGATVQLSATTRDASNNVLTGRVITWSSPNSGIATVSSNGLVSAMGAGTVQITATSEGVTGSGSVTVTIPPPPPPPGSSNEPTGMTLIDERPFNSLAEHAYPYAPSWDTDTNLSIVSDATAPKSPSNVLRTTFPTGFAGGTAPGHAGVPFSGHRVLYISYWAKYSTNWWGHLTGVNKHGYAWANGNPIFVMEAEAVGSAPMTLRMAIQGSPSSDRWYTPNLVPGATITRGVWFRMEYVVVGNTAGNSDGTMDFWLNGVHIGSFSGLQYTSGTTSWDTFEWRPIWGGVSDVVPATQTLDVDHIYLSGKN